MKITHELTLDVSRQGIQATVPLTQNDAGIHRLRFALCNGGTPMIPSEGFYAMLYLPEGEVMDPVTLYTEAGACPGRLEYDVSPRVTAGTGKREAVLQIVDGEGKVLYSPHFAFVLAADPTGGSAVTSSPAYAAVIQAQTAAEKAAGRADEVAALAEQTAQEAEEAVATAKETLTEAVTASAEARRSAAEAEELVDSASGTVEEAKAVTAEARTLASALSASVSLAEARITNLEAAADGKLFLANRLQGTAVPNPAYDNPDEVLPTMLLTKLGDLSRSLGADQTYTLPTCVGSLFLSERFRTAYQPLCVGQSYFDLLEGQYLRYLQGRYVVTGEESAWCEPNGDTWSYYVTIPELSDLELGISLSLTGDAAAYLLSAPIHESDGNVYFPISFDNYDAFAVALPGSELIYPLEETTAEDIQVDFEPELSATAELGETISSDGTAELELTYLMRLDSETDYLNLSEVSF